MSKRRLLSRKILPSVARAYLGLALRTTRWRIIGPHAGRNVLIQIPASRHPGAIVAFWHRNLLLLPALWKWARTRNGALRLNVLISRNRDGRLIRRTVAPWDIIGIEGSSNKRGQNKGGARALRAGVKALEGGALLAITPDGPRGPAENVQAGATALGRLSRRVSVPVGGACRAVRLKTWDRMRVPLPFGRGYLCHGTPLPSGASTELLAQQIAAADQRAAHAYRASRHYVIDLIWPWVGLAASIYLRRLAARRVQSGKEIAERLEERFGRSSVPRPGGDILWLHAASVGEVRSILPLLQRFLDAWPRVTILITTATVTGCETVARHRERLTQAHRKRLIHQFAPYDVVRATRRFLNHWRPVGLLLTDSELWPGWLRQCSRRGVPVGLLNARLSQKSFSRWRQTALLTRPVFERLAFVASRGADDAAQYDRLGAKNVFCVGDLKELAPASAVDEEALNAMRHALKDRTVLTVSSTHQGEEPIIIDAIALARRKVKNLLGIIIPRHPERGAEVAELGNPAFPRRSQGALPGEEDAIWVADTLGELALFYQLADFIFIGHSLLPHGGGHNPYEALHAGAPCATGPYRANFLEAYQQLGTRFTTVNDAQSLAAWVSQETNPSQPSRPDQNGDENQSDRFVVLANTLVARVSAMTGL
ncbi:DUF374 domain-containing protein [Candidatus Kirkpatrickella diaphorinae]|uniref:3-deoxy-D-manno-octulosonic acid transferase n=1 Tax=Candidatus Kirkpatrickella diaphorinae TaxID=2984322 RepID=A0ABY6GL61_9PROT|nr:glycosyltransferase N-terminal domain-containing protein [Candidatus Kirkpatrickella diaphorinae]UYH52059.1 DUF374 domain-containing protein [Candidatus Kirkpatrickella diaphorinae]